MSIDRFVRHHVPSNSTLNSAVIEWAARRRRLDARRVDKNSVLVQMSGDTVPFVGMHGPDSSTVGRWIATRLDAYRVLRAGPGVRWAAFAADEMHRASRFANDLGWPVLVRASNLARRASEWSRPVHGPVEFEEAWHRAAPRSSRRGRSQQVVVDEWVPGRYLHVFVLDGRIVAATELVPASVHGDGRRDVRTLVRRKNARTGKSSVLAGDPIPERADHLDGRTGAGIDLAYLPRKGERVMLQSTPRQGVELMDVTNEIDPAVGGLAEQALNVAPGLPHAGVDIVLRDDREPVITGIRYEPPPYGQFPTTGRRRNLGEAVVDHYLETPLWRTARATPHVPATA